MNPATLQALKDAWQPISTAPKDGTDIFLFGWCLDWTKDNSKRAEFQVMTIGFWNDHIGGFQSERDDTADYFEPTHWMPLPPPPVEEGSL